MFKIGDRVRIKLSARTSFAGKEGLVVSRRKRSDYLLKLDESTPYDGCLWFRDAELEAVDERGGK